MSFFLVVDVVIFNVGGIGGWILNDLIDVGVMNIFVFNLFGYVVLVDELFEW